MTVLPHNTKNIDIEMGFVEESEPEEISKDNPTQSLAEDILLLGFLGGLRRIKDECNSLKAEYDILVGNIDQEELAQVMEDIDESYLKSQGDIDTAIDMINNYINEHVSSEDE